MSQTSPLLYTHHAHTILFNGSYLELPIAPVPYCPQLYVESYMFLTNQIGNKWYIIIITIIIRLDK
jgi:hypothetical protein